MSVRAHVCACVRVCVRVCACVWVGVSDFEWTYIHYFELRPPFKKKTNLGEFEDKSAKASQRFPCTQSVGS